MVDSLRFTGLASGMDTQSIVDSMMRVKRMPLDRLNQQKQTIEWQRDEYREMNKLLAELDTFVFDGIYRQANMLTRNTSSSNSSVVTATATPNAGTISYNMEVERIATASRIQSSAAISENGKVDSTKSLWSQRDQFDSLSWKNDIESQQITVPKDGASSFQLSKGAISRIGKKEGEEFVEQSTLQVGGKEYQIVKGEIPKEGLESGKVYIDDNSGRMVFGEKLAGGTTFNVEFEHNFLEFNIETFNEDGSVNTKESNFVISGNTSLDSMFTQINGSNVGINLFYDSFTEKVVLQRKDTGELTNENGDFIKFTGDSAAFFTDSLKLAKNADGTNYEEGQNAKFTINGLETQRASNTFTMSGVTFTLHNSSDEAVTVGVSTDTDSIMETIKEFVDKYNEVIGKINDKLGEEKHSSYTPLTEEQKEAMSEKEIEKWEEMAKSGLLRRDQILTSGLQNMRTALYGEVISNENTRTDKNYNQLAEIGITTSKNYMDRGKLEINEDKLRAALEDNPEAIYQLFMADGPTNAEKGLARRVRDSISSTIDRIEERAGNALRTEQNYTLGKQLLNIKDDISSLEDRLKMTEQRYWNQFNAMETAIQNLNNQSSQLMSYLGMGQQQ